MDAKNLSIIIIVTIWILGLIVSGILALVFKEKYKSLKKFNKEVIETLKTLEKDFQLEEIKIEFELPMDEKCYFFEKNIKVHKMKIKRKDKREGSLNLGIYVTNKRIMLETLEGYTQYPLSWIENYFYSPIYLEKNWVSTTHLTLKGDKFLLITENNFNLLLTIKKLKNGV